MISGGFAGDKESSSARKAHLRSIRSGGTLEIQAISKLPRLDTTITFSDSDMEGCQHPHDDPLVIRVIVANKKKSTGSSLTMEVWLTSSSHQLSTNGYWKGEARASQHLPMWILWRKGTGFGFDTTGAHFGRPPMLGHNNINISHSRCPIILQRVAGKALSQYHKGHPLRLPHGHQIPDCKWSRNSSGEPTRSQGVLLSINETKNGRQHLHGRPQYARRGKHPTCALRKTRASTA